MDLVGLLCLVSKHCVGSTCTSAMVKGVLLLRSLFG